MTISELIKELSKFKNKDLPIYVTLPNYFDNIEVTSVSLYDNEENHDKNNPLGINIKY